MRRARATIQAEAVMIQKKKGAEAVMPEAVTGRHQSLISTLLITEFGWSITKQ
jgi:hypothetical protein